MPLTSMRTNRVHLEPQHPVQYPHRRFSRQTWHLLDRIDRLVVEPSCIEEDGLGIRNQATQPIPACIVTSLLPVWCRWSAKASIADRRQLRS